MAINPNLVGVPAQSKNLDTAITTTTAGLVHRQIISIADPETATSYARVSGDSLQVSVQNATLAVTQSGTFNITNISGTVSLPTGASTATLQTTGNTSLNSIDTKTPALSGGRVPVESNLVQGLTDTQLRASDVPVSFARLSSAADSVSAVQSGTWNITNISGTVSLPTGASTSDLQTTGNTSLSSIDTKTPSLSSGRVPVESNLVQGLTDTQLRASAVPVSAASLPLPTGAATESTLVALSAKVVNGYSFHHSASNATTTIKSGAGVLKRVTVNTLGSALNTCTIYDNTAGSGTIIAVIDPTLARAIFEYDLVFNTGLTIVTATGTAADLTIVYQ